MRKKVPLSRLLAIVMSFFMLVSLVPVYSIIDAFALDLSYDWNEDATGQDLTGVTQVNVLPGADGRLQLVEPEVTLVASEDVQSGGDMEILVDSSVTSINMLWENGSGSSGDLVIIPKISYTGSNTLTLNIIDSGSEGRFRIGEVNLSDNSANLILSGDEFIRQNINKITGTMNSLEVNGSYTMLEGEGISAQMEKLTVTGWLNITTKNSTSQDSEPSLPCITNVREIYISGYLVAACGNNNTADTKSPAAIILPAGGKIVVERGGGLNATGADGSYSGSDSGPGIWAKGNAYICVKDNAEFESRTAGFYDAGFRADGSVVMDIYRAAATIIGGQHNSDKAAVEGDEQNGSLTVNFMAVGEVSDGVKPSFVMENNNTSAADCEDAVPVYIHRGVPGKFNLSITPAGSDIIGDPDTDDSFQLLAPCTVSYEPDGTNPFYIYCGVDEATPNPGTTFTISGGDLEDEEITTGSKGIAGLPFGIEDGTYAVSVMEQDFNITVSNGLMDYSDSEAGISISDKGYALVVLTAPPVPLTFTAQETGGVAGMKDTTGISLTFDQEVTNLPPEAVSVSQGTINNPTKGIGNKWQLSFTDLGNLTEGDTVEVSVDNWGSYSIQTGPQQVEIHRRGEEVTYTGEQVGGSYGLVESTGILLTFDRDIDLTDSQVEVIGATKGVITDNGDGDPTTWLIPISNITEASLVHVKIIDGDTYPVKQGNVPVTIYRIKTKEITFTAVQQDGVDGMSNTTGILLTFSEEIEGLTVDKIMLTGENVMKGSVNPVNGDSTKWILTVAGNYANGVNATLEISGWAVDTHYYSVLTTQQNVALYKDSRASVTYTATQVGGQAGVTATKAILLTFSQPVAIADTDQVLNQVEGATAGTWTDNDDSDGTTWLLSISNITSDTVKISLKDWGMYIIDIAPHDVVVHRAGTLSYTAIQVGGEDTVRDTTGILLTFNEPVDLKDQDVEIAYALGGTMLSSFRGELTDNGDDDSKTWMLNVNLMRSIGDSDSGDNGKTIKVTVGDENGLLPSGGGQERKLVSRETFVVVYQDRNFRVNYTVKQLDGTDGLSDTLKLEVTFNTRPEGAVNSIFSPTYFKKDSKFTVDGAYLSHVVHDTNGVFLLYLNTTSFKNRDQVTVSVDDHWLYYNGQKCLVETEPQTVTVYKNTRIWTNFSLYADGIQGRKDSTKVRLTLKEPIAGLTRDNLKVTGPSGTSIKTGTFTTQDNRIWELEVLEFEAGTACIEIIDVPGYTFQLPGYIQLNKDTRQVVKILKCEQIGGIDKEHPTMSLKFTFDRELTEDNIKQSKYEVKKDGLVKVFEGKLTEDNDGDARTWSAVLVSNSNLADSLNANGKMRNGDLYDVEVTVDSYILRMEPPVVKDIKVYNVEAKLADNIHIEAVSPSTVHFDSELNKITLVGYFGEKGAENVADIYISKDGSNPQSLPIIRDSKHVPGSFRQTVSADISDVAMLKEMGIYHVWARIIYQGAESYTNTVTLEVVDDPIYLQNMYGILAVTQKPDLGYVTEFFSGEDEMKANKTQGTTLLTFRGRVSEFGNVWTVLGDTLVNGSLDFRASGGDTITVTKPNEDGILVTSSGGNLRWNGINVTEKFEIVLEPDTKYRSKRNEASLGLEDVFLTNKSGNPNLNIFVLAAEVEKIKVYDGEFSVGGWIRIGGTLPPFIGDTLAVDFTLYDMLLTGAGFNSIPPVHADGNAEFNPGALFGDFIGGGGAFGFELDTMPETNPNFMGLSGTLDIKNAIYLEGEFVFQWGLLNGKMAFVPDTIKVFGRVDNAAGVPLVPPTIVAYINGIGGGISGLGDTVYGKSTIPPVALSLSAAMTDVTGKLISIDKATITLGPSIFSIGADQATLLEFIKLEPVMAYIKSDMVNGYLDVTTGALGAVSILDGMIKGRIEFAGAIHGAYLASAAKSYFSSVGKDSFRLPNSSEIMDLYNSFDVMAELDASAQVEFLGLLVRAYGNLYASKVLLSGRVGAGVRIDNKWREFEVGIRYYINENKLEFSSFGENLAPENEMTIVSGENGEKLVLTNVRTVGSSGSGAFSPRMGTFGAASMATLDGMEEDYIVSIYSDTKHPEIQVYKDDGLKETLTDIQWSETSPSFTDNGKYVVLYMIEEAGDYGFQADGELKCIAYDILPLSSLDSIDVNDGTETVSWTYNRAQEQDDDLFVRLLLRDAVTDEILTNLTIDENKNYIKASDRSFQYDLPDTLASGSYYITAQLFKFTDNIPGQTEQMEQTLDDISSDPFEFTNSYAPSSVTNVGVTLMPNGEFEVSWDELTEADGYLITIFDQDAPVSGLAPVDVSAKSETSLKLQGGIFHMTDEVTGETMEVGMEFGKEYQVCVQSYKNGIVSKGIQDGEQYSVPIYSKGTLKEFTLNEPQIPNIVFSVDHGQMSEVSGIKIYSVNTKTPRLTVEAQDANEIKVRLDDQLLAEENDVYNLSFEEDGYYSVDIEAIGSTGDIGHETVNLQIDTVAPVLRVDEDSAHAVDGKVRIFGFSEAGTSVTVNGRLATMSGSTFEFITDFDSDNAVNLFSLVATDMAGNETTRILSVTNAEQENKQTKVILFNANGGTGFMASETVSSGGSYTLPSNTGFTRDGYTFRGWSLIADGTVLSVGHVIKNITEDITIYAQWKKDSNVPPGGGVGSGGSSTQPEKQPDSTEKQSYANPFNDVGENAWYYDPVMYVYTNELMLGTSKSPMLFSPEIPVTRSMILTILYRYTGSPDVSGLKNPFSDVPEGEWYTDASKWAQTNGIALGYGNGKLGSGDIITRQDLAVILTRFASLTNIKLPSEREYSQFNDESDIADYALESVINLYKAEIINGKPGHVFDPEGQATRAEVAAMLYRFLE